MALVSPPIAEAKPRWFQPTPGRVLLLLLAVEAILFFSERFHWFPFNSHKGWTVLIATATVLATMALMLLWFLAALCFRRRFQFSIRSLLMLTVVVAIPSSWLAVELQNARKQRAAIKVIELAGGRANYDDGTFGTSPASTPAWLSPLFGDDFFVNVAFVELAGSEATDATLECLDSLPQLRTLNLRKTCVTDAGLRHLEGLHQLLELKLGDTHATDASLEYLGQMPHLFGLDLYKARISDAGLKHLKGLTELAELSLNDTRVTNAGLEHLEGLTRLEDLYLNDTEITDAGLKHLARLTHLQILWLCDTKVTEKGIKSLEQTLPACSIHFRHGW